MTVKDRAGQDPATTTVNAYLRRDHRDRMTYRLRRHARPHLILAGLWAAAAAGHVGGLVVGDPTLVAAAVGPLALAAAVGGLLRRRRRSGRQVAGSLAAVGWLTWVTAAGPSWGTTAVLVVVGLAASLRWWRRIRLPDPPLQLPPPLADDVDPNHPPALWAKHNASDGAALPRSYLTVETETTTGLRYDLRLVPGRQTLAKALGVLPQLRTGLLLRPHQDLILEQHPDADESVVALTIVRQSPVLSVSVEWPGHTYDQAAGTVALGPYVDAEGTAEWIVRTTNRLHGGFLAGSIGSGKSRMLEGLALGYAEAGCAVWFGDPQGGASSAFLADHADDAARSVAGIHGMLQHAQRAKALRQVENALNRWEGWTPEQGRPGLVIIIDECHRALEVPEIQALATELAREGGKLGIALVLASQVATLDAFGGKGGADALRSSVCSGNLVILRSKTRNTSNVLPGVDVNPTTFPRIPGYAYLIDDTGTRRTAPLRGYYLTDEARDTAAEAVIWPELDEAAAGAIGADYRNRRALAERDMTALSEWYSAMREGRQPSTVPPLLQRPAEATAVPRPAPAGPGPRVMRVIRWRTHRVAGTQAPRRNAADAVYDLVAAGIVSPGELAKQSGYSDRQVYNALAALADAGRVHNPRKGVWEPTAVPASS
jgi:hypothetical protein